MEIVYRIPEISTVHIPMEVAAALDSEHQEWCACAVYRDVGFFLYLNDELGKHDNAPQCLIDIRDWLQLRGYTDCWIRLDCDGEIVDDLPAYDW